MQIGLPYTINFTDPSLPGKQPFVIEPNTTNGPLAPNIDSPDSSATEYHTSITLPGMGLIQYGERIDETLVHMLEHFASKTPPVKPTIGQLWYDCSLNPYVMKVWNGVNWGAVSSNGTRAASSAEYNSLIADINYVIGMPSGTTDTTAHGYGQTPLVPIMNRAVSTLEWVNLINVVRKMGLHQGTAIPNLVDTDFTLPGNDTVSFGLLTLVQIFNDLQTAIAAIKVGCLRVGSGTLETDLSGLGTFERTTAWNSSIEHQVRMVFQSDAHARAYFNSGGAITFRAGISNTTQQDDVVFATMLTAMGITRMTAFGATGTNFTSAIGFYKLTAVDQVLRTQTSTGSTGTAKVELRMRYDATTASLTVRVTYTAVRIGWGAALYNDGIIGGNLLSSIGMQKASELYLNNPELPYPTVTTVRALN